MNYDTTAYINYRSKFFSYVYISYSVLTFMGQKQKGICLGKEKILYKITLDLNRPKFSNL